MILDKASAILLLYIMIQKKKKNTSSIKWFEQYNKWFSIDCLYNNNIYQTWNTGTGLWQASQITRSRSAYKGKEWIGIDDCCTLTVFKYYLHLYVFYINNQWIRIYCCEFINFSNTGLHVPSFLKEQARNEREWVKTN